MPSNSDVSILLATTLGKRIGKKTIGVLSRQAEQADAVREALFDLVFSEDMCIANNAAWVLTYCSKQTDRFLETKQQDLITRCLAAADPTHHRLLLTILAKQRFSQPFPTTLFNKCLDGIDDPSTPSAIRALYIRIAHQLSKTDAGLHSEFLALIRYIDPSLCPPSVRSAIRQVLTATPPAFSALR